MAHARIAVLSLVVCALCASALVGCGDAAPAKAPTPEGPRTTAADAGVATTDDPDVVGDNPAKPRPRPPFTIHSSCQNVVTIVFGEDPKVTGAGRRTLSGNTAIDGPRDPDGKATVNLLDDKGEPIAKVHVTRRMKQLEIGRSCRTLDAQ